MAVLGGEFAMIVLVSGSAIDVDTLASGTEGLGATLGLSITLKRTTSPHVTAGTRPYLIESVSLDTPGIVHAITSILRGYGINIEDLETDTTAAPFSGAPMFTLKARILVPPGVTISRLREEIENLAEERDLDIAMQPISSNPI